MPISSKIRKSIFRMIGSSDRHSDQDTAGPLAADMREENRIDAGYFNISNVGTGANEFSRDSSSTGSGPLSDTRNPAALPDEAHQFLNAVIANTPHIVFWKDQDGTYLGCNKNFLAIRNIEDSTKVIGKRLSDFALDSDEATLAEAVDAIVIDTGIPNLNVKEKIKTGDGRVLSIETSKMPIRDETGAVIGLVGIGSDITEKELAEKGLQLARESLEQRVKERTSELEAEISERRQAENALRESEERLLAIADNSTNLIVLKDIQGRILFANNTFAGAFDLTPKEVIGNTVRELRDDGEATRLVEQSDAKVIETGKPTALEFEYYHKNQLRARKLEKFPIRDDQGNVKRIAAIGTDITERILMEKALRKSEERFRGFAESCADWLWETDAECRFTYVSDRTRELLGYAPHEVIGKTCEELSTSERGNLVWTAINDFIRVGGTFRDFEIETDSANGEERYLSISGKPRFEDDGQFIGYRGTGTDITERVNSRRRECEAEERYLAAINTVPLAVALFNEEDRLVIGNERFQKNLLSPGTLPLGKSFEEIVRGEMNIGTLPDAKGREEAWLKARVDSHQNPSGDIVLHRHNGWFQVAEHKTADGYTLVVYQDITKSKEAEEELVTARDELELRVQERTRALEQEIFERKYVQAELQKANDELEKRVDERTQHLREEMAERKKVEQQFIQAQKMEAVGQMAGGIAHDFNNLLTVIIGNLSWLEDFVQPNEKAIKVTALALEGARRAGNLTHRMLTFSRHEDLCPVELDIEKTVTGIEPLITRALRENISFKTDVSPKIWPMMADPHQLENAVLNLAINARDAMPDGGSLTLRAENCVVVEGHALTANGCETGEYILLSMIDSGTGMSSELRERVFDPFFTTKEVGVGSGLGLSMVFAFVNQSGGFIEIDSEVGRGTTVKIYFHRAAQPKTEDTEQIEPDTLNSEGLKVLVVEDDSLVRDVTMEYLRMSGIETLEACDGASAISTLEENGPVDLVVSDVMMPGMSGVDLKKTVVNRWPGTRFLLISGYSYDEFSRRGIDRDSIGLLPKPFSKSQLLSRVGEIMTEC